MSSNLFDRVREGLVAQRRNLEEWLQQTRPETKKVRLGASGEESVTEHLQTLDAAIGKAEDRTLGLCEVCHDYIESTRLEMDYTACVCLEHMTGEQKARLEQELELSQKVQQALLPQHIPQVPGLHISVYTQPAQIVGGDYFDFFELSSSRFGFAVGDVMGKGMPASLLMANMQASLRILVKDLDTPDVVFDRLNRLFVHNIRLTKFVTLFLAHFDRADRMLTYSNAGHNPPLWWRAGPADGAVAWLHPTGPAIGLVEQPEFRFERIQLNSGDVVVFYTDGVTETHNEAEEQFGEERLAGLVRKNAGKSPAELVRVIKDAVKSFAGTTIPSDDTTILVAKAS